MSYVLHWFAEIRIIAANVLKPAIPFNLAMKLFFLCWTTSKIAYVYIITI